MESAKRLNIDNIDDMMELLEIMKSLGISGKGLETKNEMKAKVKEHLRKNSLDSAEKAFSVVSKAKDADMRKRELLRDLFSQTTACIDQLDDPALSILNKQFGNVKDRITTNQSRLVQRDYYILVAGETSSGKSSFLNLLLGEELLPSAVLSSTSTICELKYGTQRKLVLHFKDLDPETGLPTKSILLNPRGESSYMKQISSFVHMKADREKGSPFNKVEIFWPHELLQNGITVIDSPGIGESEMMDTIVENYLANAFAFIYIINSANAGGVQKDRIGKLLRGVKKISDERNERFPSKCALFICNKWDTIQEGEQQEVKDYVTKQLKGCWPDLDPRSQIVYLSTRKATEAKAHGIVSRDFQIFVSRINAMILTAIGTTLHSHWEWLRYLLSRIIYQTKAFINNAKRSRKEVREQMKEVTTRIKLIEDNKDDTIKELQCQLDENLKETVQKLINHLKSKDIQKKFCSWPNEDVVDKEVKSWGVAGPAIMKVFESRLRLFIEEWEEENHVFANTISSLKQHIVQKWNLVESQLWQLENDVVTDDSGDATKYPVNTGDVNHNMSTRRKVIIAATSPLWIPLTLAVGVIAVPVLGIMTIKDKIVDANTFRKYKKDPIAFLATFAFSYLDEMTSDSNMLSFAKPQFDEAAKYMHHMRDRIPEIIDENRKLIWQLESETRSKKEIWQFYLPIYEKACAIKGDLDLLGLKEIRRMDIHDSTLKYGSRLRDGDFGFVYQGKWNKHHEGTFDVAIKVSHNVLDSSTVSSFLEEEETLRKLNHPHIVKFYGASLRKEKTGTRMILVVELLQINLRDYINMHNDKVPGKSQNLADLKKSVQWAVEISDALQYMHMLDIVHRDLKLDNILVTQSESHVKVGDVGIAKREQDITGTVAGTALYMAPEVWASKSYNSAVDMYSLGITMWEMWYGKFAFFEYKGITAGDLEKKIKEGSRPTHVIACQEPRWRWKYVMERCWAADPEHRLNAAACHQSLKSLLHDCSAEVTTL